MGHGIGAPEETPYSEKAISIVHARVIPMQRKYPPETHLARLTQKE